MADKQFRAGQTEDLAAGKITSGTFADARIAESNVTQHEAALTITESQISDLGTYLTSLVEDTSPQLGGTLNMQTYNLQFQGSQVYITDPNGNESVGFAYTASAVNHLRFDNAATGSDPEILAEGGDTNISINFIPKGSGVVKAGGNQVLTTASTLSNRINPRTSSTTSTATLTPSLATANVFYLTAQAAALTVAAPTGTPMIGETISINILDDGTARSLTFNAAFKFIGAAAPTTTTISKWMVVTAQYNGTDWLTTWAEEV